MVDGLLQASAMTAWWKRFLCLVAYGWALAVVVCPAGCGTVDPGERSLARWSRTPDPTTFGRSVHPALGASCATSGCHRRTTTFSLHPADPLPVDQRADNPEDLPDRLRTDFFTVLAFCDLDVEEQSPLIRWGSGQQPSHPGGEALSASDRDAIIQWLEEAR